MADYHAVLKRTLSGFSNPQPQLRTKLYERARATIARQLANRNPPLAADALNAELHKLEVAITSIEQGYDPTYQGTTSAAEPEQAAVIDPAAEPAADSNPEENVAAPAADPPVVEEPIPALEELPPAIDPIDPVLEELAIPEPPLAAEPLPEPEIEAPVVVEEIPPAPVVETEPVAPPAPEPQYVEEVAPEAVAEVPVAVESDPYAAEVAPAAEDAMDQWAKEFMATQEEPAADVSLPPADPLPELTATEPPVVATAPAASIDPLPPVPEFETQTVSPADDTLSIPPAVGFGENRSRRPKKRGWLKWLFMLVLLGLLAGLGYLGWTNKETLLERFDLSYLLEDPNDPTKPKPVKTITIKPEPSEPEANAVEQPAPKSEERLGENGEETNAAPAQPTITPAPTAPEQPQPANSGGLLVAQNAILYEEGAQASENTVDSGRVVWSVVEEAPAAGEPAEPAIRGRVEIPSRDTVLIMTIKRNADKALPASHLIELVFAVPDNFSGGSIGQINRFVLKESEQGRGEGLVGVPARIADGIFLIALNNLAEAITKNESLLKTRDWIDIPMQYRTGRRALITIEKGVPGEKVFKEVFDAWAKL